MRKLELGSFDPSKRKTKMDGGNDLAHTLKVANLIETGEIFTRSRRPLCSRGRRAVASVSALGVSVVAMLDSCSDVISDCVGEILAIDWKRRQ